MKDRGAGEASGALFYVLMPTHNRAGLLPRAIESVQAQTYPNWVLLVHDDGSADDTPGVLQRFATDPRIETSRFDENQGVNAARNVLLERILAKPEPGFVVILDDDDTLAPRALEQLAEAADGAPEVSWFIAHCRFPDGRRVAQIKNPEQPICYVRDNKLGDRLSGDVALVFHTRIIGDARYSTDFPNAEEWWFYADLATRSKMHVVDFEAKNVDYLESGLTLSQPNRHRAAQVFEKKLERFEPFLDRPARAKMLARLGRHLIASGEAGAGFGRLRDAFRSWPFEHRIYVVALEALFGVPRQLLTRKRR